MITGMARSGTTLLSNLLDSNSKIVCYPDLFNEFFKGYIRFLYYKIENKKIDCDLPIDNFFFLENYKIFKYLDNANLRHKIPSFIRKQIIQRSIIRDAQYNKEIKEVFKNSKSKYFDTMFLEVLQKLSKKDKIIAFKTAWCEQLIEPLNNSFKNMMFINVIRDPRAVIASNFSYSRNHRYPILFNIRDWRKSIYYSWRVNNKFKSKKYFQIIKYEDLIKNTNKTLLNLFNNFNLKVFDLKDIKKLKSNSSYKENKNDNKIFDHSIDKWKSVLPKEVIIEIEKYCFNELKKLSYKTYINNNKKIEFDNSFKYFKFKNLSKWCKKILINEKIYFDCWLRYNFHLENIRTLINKKSDKNLIEIFFYEKKYLDWLLK